MKLEERLLKRQQSFYWFRKKDEIVKYKPEGYTKDGVYTLDEWTDYSCIGNTFSGHLLSREEYLQVENNYVQCVKDILRIADCYYVTIGWLWRKNIKLNNRVLHSGSRLRIQDIDNIIKGNLRGSIEWILVNLSKKVQIDFGWDYYMHVICPISKSKLNKIVRAHGLYLNPREQRHFLKIEE